MERKHDRRHAARVRAIEALNLPPKPRVDLEEIRKALGHTSPDAMTRYYAAALGSVRRRP